VDTDPEGGVGPPGGPAFQWKLCGELFFSRAWSGLCEEEWVWLMSDGEATRSG